MRTTVTLDAELVERAQRATGVTPPNALLRAA